MNEEWRPVHGWEGDFEISNMGRVRRVSPKRGTWPGRVFVGQPNSRGYLRVSLRRHADGAQSFCFVHALVAAAFIGPRPEGTVVAHGDGNHLNNCVSNLRYCTNKENEADKILHGTKASGERNGHHKLCEDDVRRIRKRYVRGSSVDGALPMAKEFGVSPATMRSVVKGRTWIGVRT